jgi:NADH pyrophosphatase NudC (nudix superfamily)
MERTLPETAAEERRGGKMDGLREMLAVMTPEEFRTAARERELEEWRAVNRFCGEYMSAYSWATFTEAHLEQKSYGGKK